MSVTIPNKQANLHGRRSARLVSQVERFETSSSLLPPLQYSKDHRIGEVSLFRLHHGQPPKNNSKDSVCSVGWALRWVWYPQRESYQGRWRWRCTGEIPGPGGGEGLAEPSKEKKKEGG